MENKKYLGGDKYFYGNEISEYGRKYGRVDYRALAKSFDAVLNNSIIEVAAKMGMFFEPVQGGHNWDNDIDELIEKQNEFTEDSPEYLDLQEQIDKLEDERDTDYPEIYQYYIIDNVGVDILQYWCPEEYLYYCEELDMYLWGVDHYGTSWAYVLTDIEIAKDNEE